MIKRDIWQTLSELWSNWQQVCYLIKETIWLKYLKGRWGEVCNKAKNWKNDPQTVRN